MTKKSLALLASVLMLSALVLSGCSSSTDQPVEEIVVDQEMPTEVQADEMSADEEGEASAEEGEMSADEEGEASAE